MTDVQYGPLGSDPRYGLDRTPEEIADREAFRAEVLAQFGCTTEEVDALTGRIHDLTRARADMLRHPGVFRDALDRRRANIAAQAPDGRLVLLEMAKEAGCPYCAMDCPLDRDPDDPNVCRCGQMDWGAA